MAPLYVSGINLRAHLLYSFTLRHSKQYCARARHSTCMSVLSERQDVT